MKKTTLVVDEALVEQARRILGTHSLKDTVHSALEQVITADARHWLIRRLVSQDGLDLADTEVMRRAWSG
jgi:Arc/MetJ family transcription regulator